MSKWPNCFCILAALLVGCSGKIVTEKPNINAVTESIAKENLRKNTIKQVAREYGTQSGLAWQARSLNMMLNRYEYKLNTIFNFNFLILGSEVLPPILVEGSCRFEHADEDTIVTSDRVYRIIQMPKLITVSPTWKQYLVINIQKPETPNRSLLPKTTEEKVIWNEAVRKGWFEGMEQANQIFELNLNKLLRDFNGMVLYHKLLVQNIVTPPYLSEAENGIVGGDNELRINERLLRISTTAKFNFNGESWKPVGVHKMNEFYSRERMEGTNGIKKVNDYGGE